MTDHGRDAVDLTVRAHLRRDGFELDVDVEVPAGRTVALLGPNGAGKSTLLAVIAGLDAVGTADVSDVRVALGPTVLTDTASATFVAPERRSVGVVFQDHLLFDHLDVLDNVAFGPRSTGRSRAEAHAIARELIDRLDLGELTHRRPAELSGGQAQRVAIARTLAADPAILLFDEPLAALDVESRRDLRRLLRRHLDEFDGPRLVITHDPTDAFVLADDVIVIEHGRITQRGTPDDIRRHPTTPYVAALGGTNLLTGRARDGTVVLDDGAGTLTIADTAVDGDVILTIHPRAISLHSARPEGSQRNTWASTVELVEPLGDTVRVSLARPLAVSADVTPGAVEALGLTPGSTVWAAVKATEIGAAPN